MVSANVKRIFQQAQVLSDAEHEGLRDLLIERTAKRNELTKQQQVRQALVQRGLLEKDSPKGKDPERYRRWQPIPINGKPLSETLIEERR